MGVTPRNSFRQETTTQGNGQQQQHQWGPKQCLHPRQWSDPDRESSQRRRVYRQLHLVLLCASEGGGRKKDPERKRWSWTEDCKPTQRQHQLSNQHLPHWTEGMLLRSLSQPRFIWPLMHCSRIFC